MDNIYHSGDLCFIKNSMIGKNAQMMQNHQSNSETGGRRPHFYCYRDSKTGLLWMIPLSTRIQKFQTVIDDRLSRHKRCDHIAIKNLPNIGKRVILYQNMFPVTKKYIDGLFINRVGQKMCVSDPYLKNQIIGEAKSVLADMRNHRAISFVDIRSLERNVLQELSADREQEIKANHEVGNIPYSEIRDWCENPIYKRLKSNDFQYIKESLNDELLYAAFIRPDGVVNIAYDRNDDSKYNKVIENKMQQQQQEAINQTKAETAAHQQKNEEIEHDHN